MIEPTASDDQDELDELRRAVDKQRPHAGFFAWYDRSPAGKSLAERGIVESLLESMEKAGDHRFEQPLSVQSDWPDCTVRSERGILAVEVTELVDPAAVAGKETARVWTPERFLCALQERIFTKDQKSHHGAMYRGVVLVVHTDERDLDPERYLQIALAHSFGRTKNLTDAYLLFSYHPRWQRCPYARLCLGS